MSFSDFQWGVAFFLAVGICGTISLRLFDLYRVNAKPGETQLADRWSRRWEFSPQTLGGFSYSSLILVSVLGLFLELLLIRWISSEIRIFAYFKNFVLIACFLGFGLGCYLCQRKINLLATLAPLVTLAGLVKLPWKGLHDAIGSLPFLLGAISDVHMWGVPSVPLNWSSGSGVVVAVAMVVPLFALLALAFIPIGQMVGWLLENAENGILAYSVNVLGSLAGILLYTLLCFLYQPPAVWFLVAGAMLVILLWKNPTLRWTAALAFAACVGLLSLSVAPGTAVFWSPYQKLEMSPHVEAGETVSYNLLTNDSWYQHVIDLSPGFVASHPNYFRDVPISLNAYNLPYRFYPNPPSVLILGAGMGNDVAAALRNGAERVVAVEIDPLILKLGRQIHFEKPYDSSRVQQVVDDARSYVENSRDRFDLIVFSLLDSHTTSSHFSNIRIDNYVYTVEALQAAKRLLEPNGVFIIKFQVETPWIAGRLHGLLSNVFGHSPLQMQAEQSYTISGRFFISGSEQKIAEAMSNPNFGPYVREHSNVKMEKATLTTDDWPYFYQHEPGIPATVLVISVVLAAMCWLAIRKTGTSVRSMRWHYFFLGAGFLLLEVQIISKMALLFGTTWVVNSIVISGLLLVIVASNVLVDKVPKIPFGLAYAGIFASIALSYSIPLQQFFFPSVWLKGLVATAVLCLPVFFAGIIFIKSFARSRFSGEALGSNLMGAMLGGLLESVSLWTGLHSLLLLAALFYLASYLTVREKQIAGVGTA